MFRSGSAARVYIRRGHSANLACLPLSTAILRALPLVLTIIHLLNSIEFTSLVNSMQRSDGSPPFSLFMLQERTDFELERIGQALGATSIGSHEAGAFQPASEEPVDDGLTRQNVRVRFSTWSILESF